MTSLSELESDAQHLRACLQRASPLHSLLCGLQFFEKLAADSRPAIAGFIEASLREFIPDLVTAISKTDASDLSPSEAKNLAGLQALAHAGRDVVASSDLAALSVFLTRVSARPPLAPPAVADDQVALAGLFVEYNPDLRLPPRGRLLWLRVEAEERRHGKPDDEPVIRNSIVRPDDEFRHQADIAVKLAREYLISRHGLDPHKRFRIDFDVLGSPAAMTGPSLGLAMAVGAVVAIAKREVLRCTLEVPTGVAFSGALSDDGRIRSIDGEGLRLKLACALHTGLKHLVVPRAHITEAWEFLRSQEASRPEHPLRLIDADDLASVVDDRNLVFPQRRTATSYQVRRVRKSLRQPRVGLPILLTLLALFAVIAWPIVRSWLDSNPTTIEETRRGFKALNQYGRVLWEREVGCDSLARHPENHCVADVDGDGWNEILFAPEATQSCEDANWFYCFGHDNQVRFRRYCGAPVRDPTLEPSTIFHFEHLNVVSIASQAVIVTEAASSSPSRSHIRLWSATGDSLGWYVNRGGSQFFLAEDLNDDGRQELIFQCYFACSNRTSLLVLSVDSASGFSPSCSAEGTSPDLFPRGRQYSYLVFPSSNLARVDVQSGYSQPHHISQNASEFLDIYTGESNQSPYASVIYRLDKNLRVRRVSSTEQFISRWSQLTQVTTLPPLDIDLYAARLRDSVIAWTRAGWVQATGPN